MRAQMTFIGLAFIIACASSVMTDAMLDYSAQYTAIEQSWSSKYELSGVYGTNTVPLL